MDVIYLVWADRGEYSDRREYPVAWFAKRADAEQRASELTKISARWARFVHDEDYKGEPREDRARAALGDAEWTEWSDTIYKVREIPRGTLAPIANPGAP